MGWCSAEVLEALLTPRQIRLCRMGGGTLFFDRTKLHAAWSRASICRWRQQSVPHSGQLLNLPRRHSTTIVLNVRLIRGVVIFLDFGMLWSQ